MHELYINSTAHKDGIKEMCFSNKGAKFCIVWTITIIDDHVRKKMLNLFFALAHNLSLKEWLFLYKRVWMKIDKQTNDKQNRYENSYPFLIFDHW